jgi:hypothetical protein
VEDFLLRFDVKAEQSAIHDMISSADSGERKAGIFMIGHYSFAFPKLSFSFF